MSWAMSLTEPPRTQRRVPLETPPGPPPRRPVDPMLWSLVFVMVGLEVAQHLAGQGMFPEIFERVYVYSAFAFFDGEFERAIHGGGVSGQLLWSTVTHAFLHAGWLHLGLNMAAFLGLGHVIIQAIGLGRFLATFAVCAIAGALALGIISDVRGPLVGASGAIFGFLAMVTAWQERALARRGLSRRAIWMRVAGLVAINAVLAVGLGGLLAWEAHLGGAVAGWLLGLVWRPAPGATRLPI